MHEPGPLIATGRAADVYAYGDGLVLRRYRSPHSVLHEAAVMQYVRDHGYPAPRVVEVAGRDLVMERAEGPTMLRAFIKRPAGLWSHAATLADLLKLLHAIPAPAWLQPRFPYGDSLVHLDLHPDNVIMSPSGPIVIDWTNAGRGDADAEIAHLWLVMATSVAPVGPLERLLLAAGRLLFVRAFLGHFDRARLKPHIAQVAEHRLSDRNVLNVEHGRIARFVERYG